MFSPRTLLLVASCVLAVSGQEELRPRPPRPTSSKGISSTGVAATSTASAVPSQTSLPGPKPVNYGVLLFPSFQAIDVFGPLDLLNILSLSQPLNLAVIAATMDPVSTKPQSAAMNVHNSNFSESIVPTHTLASPPSDLEVLIIPGGLGTRAPDLNDTIAYVKDVFPTLKYLITVCTGAGIAARAGVLDGRYATTNKKAWLQTIAHGPKTTWIPEARWLADNSSSVAPFVWTTSGVAAGIDGTIAFIASVYGDDVATNLANGMEHVRQYSWQDDPFAKFYNLSQVVYPLAN